MGKTGTALSTGDVNVNNKATDTIPANTADGIAISGDTINVIDNSGLIEAKGINGDAIDTDVKDTVANGGGVISGVLRGINANSPTSPTPARSGNGRQRHRHFRRQYGKCRQFGHDPSEGTGGVAIVALASTPRCTI